MTLRGSTALIQPRRATRVACLVVSIATLSISQPAHAQSTEAARAEVGAMGSIALGSRDLPSPHYKNSAPFFLSRRFLIPTYISLQALDAGATLKGFSAPGWHESNPLVPHSEAGQVAYFGLTGAGVVLGTDYLERKGHRKLAIVGRLIGIAVEGYASASSLRGLRR